MIADSETSIHNQTVPIIKQDAHRPSPLSPGTNPTPSRSQLENVRQHQSSRLSPRERHNFSKPQLANPNLRWSRRRTPSRQARPPLALFRRPSRTLLTKWRKNQTVCLDSPRHRQLCHPKFNPRSRKRCQLQRTP